MTAPPSTTQTRHDQPSAGAGPASSRSASSWAIAGYTAPNRARCPVFDASVMRLAPAYQPVATGPTRTETAMAPTRWYTTPRRPSTPMEALSRAMAATAGREVRGRARRPPMRTAHTPPAATATTAWAASRTTATRTIEAPAPTSRTTAPS